MAPAKNRRRAKPKRAAVVAALCAAALSVAGHVVGKAVRDTLYLTTFPVEWLPYFFLGTGVLSGFAVSIYTRLTTRFTPVRVLPALAAFAALTMPLLWFGSRTGSHAVVATIYVWTTISGTFVASGFWAVLGETFDPRAARQLFGLVGVASTAGGLLGGFGAHILLRVMDAEALLLSLAVLNLLMAAAVVQLGRVVAPSDDDEPSSRAPQSAERQAGLVYGVREVIRSAYLRDIAMLVIAVTVAGTLADYVLKDLAVKELQGKREIAGFFSLFHGAVGAVTLGVQILLCRPLLAKRGLAAALSALPLWLTASSVMVLLFPALPAATALRGGENAVRNSFHRAGYELLFVPLPAALKRATKPVLDALLERLADAAGAAVVLVLVTLLAYPSTSLAWLIIALAATQVWLAMRVRRGYVETLSSNLLARAVELDEVARAADDDATARAALRSTLLGKDHADLRKTLTRSQLGLSLMKSLHLEVPKQLQALKKSQVLSAGQSSAAAAQRALTGPSDPVVELVRELGDPSPAVVRAAVGRWDRKDKRPVPFLIRLLAREELYKEVTAALARAGDRIAGTLVDHLHDPDEAFAVRRRLPRALAACQGAVAIDGLVRGLCDRRFEVRFHCAAALERIQHANEAKRPPAEPVWAALRDEVKKSRSMWEAQRLLDDPDEPTPDTPGLAGVVQRRGAHSLQHVFRLLSLVLEPKPVEMSYRAVRSDDPTFRAVGLEYLENVLPVDVRSALWPLIGDDDEAPPLSTSGRSMQEVLQELAASGLAIPAPSASRPDDK
jgi:hypothetical protein